MPSSDELQQIFVVEGDGSSTTTNEDGSTITTWPSGLQRVDYPDSSAMVTFPDGAVLNIYADGTRTLNDAQGGHLDPVTGNPLGNGGPVGTPPDIGPDEVNRVLHGDKPIADAQEALSLIEAFKDALEGDISPAEWVAKWMDMVLEVVKAVETEERGCYYRGWCYGVLYAVLGMGTPPEPTFSGSLQGPDQDALDQQYWKRGVAAAADQLASGSNGVGLRNRALLRIAADGGDPAITLKEMYVAACDHTDDQQLKEAYADILSWPQATGA